MKMDEFLFEVDRMLTIVFFAIFAAILNMIVKCIFMRMMRMSKPLENDKVDRRIIVDEPLK